MKTKSKPQSKILIVLAAILCCVISINSFGQSTIIPSLQDFHGTWVGNNIDGTGVSITLTSDWKSTFTAGGAPLISDNPVIAYRLPQFISASPINGPEIAIKFFTQDAIAGVRAAASNSSVSLNDNSVSVNTNTVEKIYTAVAVISANSTTGQLEMALYIDTQNFTSVPPVLDPDPTMNRPYCILVKQ